MINKFVTPIRAACAVFLCGIATVAAFVAFAASAQADPYPPQQPCATTVQGGPFTPGADLRVISTGFEPNKTAQVILHSKQVVLANVTADANGAIDARVHIPDDLSSGSHTLTVTMPNRTCTLAVNTGPQTEPTVVASSSSSAAAPPAPRTVDGGGLAFTGVQVITALLVTVGLLVGGVVLLVLGGRRRAGSTARHGSS